MRQLLIILLLGGSSATGCAGCGALDDFDDNARTENGGTHAPWDGGDQTDAQGGVEGGDAGGRVDVGGSGDAGMNADAGNAADLTTAEDLGGAQEDLAVGPTCGDGLVEGIEVCDDGITADCTGTHDGGDGVCVPDGTCSTGFVLDGAICVPAQITQHVHIFVANDCSMTVDPVELTVPKGQTVRFAWHNHSQSYPVDVWQSYIGGFTDLAPGMTWNEQHEWCFNVNPYTGYSDISTNPSCPEHRFFIRCNGR